MKKKFMAFITAATILMCAVLSASAEEDVIRRCDLYAENHLMNMSYSDIAERDTLAVGDTLEVWYEDTVEAEVIVNGEKVSVLEPGERRIYTWDIRETGTLSIAVVQNGNELINRTFTVISSADMYRRNLKELFSFDEISIPSAEELIDAANHGFPLFNPFLIPAFGLTLFINVFTVVFSFTRIV